MTETGTFPEGLIHEGRIFTEFELAEETFAHSLQILSTPSVDGKRLNDDAYYRAAVFAQRLTVPGIETITPEMVLELSQADGSALIRVANTLETRRQEFRSSLKANQDEHGGDAEAGDSVSGNSDPAAG